MMTFSKKWLLGSALLGVAALSASVLTTHVTAAEAAKSNQTAANQSTPAQSTQGQSVPKAGKMELQRQEWIKKTVETNLGQGTKVDSVVKTNYAGLYEVRMGSELVYTDATASFLFVGSILDGKASVNYTRQRVEQITRVNFNDLPLDSALKYVKGDGKRVIAIFEDPNCGYCKKFRKTLQSVDNVTIYTFMYNILAEDSAQKSRDIWCAPNRSKAWDEWMLEGKMAPAAPASCQTPNDKVFALGQKLRVTGTPTVIFTDGTRLPGMVDVKALEEKWANLKSPAAAVAAR